MTRAESPVDLAARILDALPQTQCTRCGYDDCAAYADAVAHGQADINQCPPGGQEGVAKLAAITGRQATALDPAFGSEGPRGVALIDEAWCIGCTLCLDACPTDAIVGANKRMHTVIPIYCTGCELCLPVCPVDCILMEPVSAATTGWDAWSPAQASQARTRYAAHTLRNQQRNQARAEHNAALAQTKLANLEAHSRIADPDQLARKRSIIEAAMAKAREKRQASGS